MFILVLLPNLCQLRTDLTKEAALGPGSLTPVCYNISRFTKCSSAGVCVCVCVCVGEDLIITNFTEYVWLCQSGAILFSKTELACVILRPPGGSVLP